MTTSDQAPYKVIVGLEIHVQLDTANKLFCPCPNSFCEQPNSNVCPVCMGMPGTLPVMNRKAYELSVQIALALDCKIATFTKWDRKSYYYPDLPKNYQISQYDLPLASDGYLEIPLPDGSTKKIRILRAHLEEDAGKNVHDNPAHTCVDLNRTGVPLLEIVSQPDMNSVQEVMAYARAIQQMVQWLGVSRANMQMGHIRFEPNINLHINHSGRMFTTPIVEVKNLNSFRALERAVAYELHRQYALWQGDPENYSLEKLGKQNRGYDDHKSQTVFQREKEQAHDYRYFPEPDLVPVTVEQDWIDQIAADLPEMPLAVKSRFQEQLGLSQTDAATIVSHRTTAQLFDQAVAAGAGAQTLTKHFISFWAMLANEQNCPIGQLGIDADRMAKLAMMVDDNQISTTAAATLAGKMIESADPPDLIAQRQNLMQASDAGELEKTVDQILQANPKAVQDALAPGKKQKKAIGFLLGQVMQQTRGKSNPKIVGQIIEQKLASMNN